MDLNVIPFTHGDPYGSTYNSYYYTYNNPAKEMVFPSPIQIDAVNMIFASFEEAVQWRWRQTNGAQGQAEYMECNTAFSHPACTMVQVIWQLLRNNPAYFLSLDEYQSVLGTGITEERYAQLCQKIDDIEKQYGFCDNKILQSIIKKKNANKFAFKKPSVQPYNEPPMEYDEDGEPYDDYDGGNMSKPHNTFVILKPDAFERSLVGELMDLIESKGLKLVHAKLFTMSDEQIKEHYNHHVGKNFFPDMVDFLTSGPSLALVYNGPQACKAVRQLIGQKHPADSPPGSIRGKYAMSFPKNLIHGADSPADAQREMKIFFTTDELAELSKHGG